MTIHVGSLCHEKLQHNYKHCASNYASANMHVWKKNGPFHKKFIPTFVIDVSHLSDEILILPFKN